MNPAEDLIQSFQEWVAQVPELVQPFIVMLAGTVPFIEGEGAALVGLVGGLNPIVVDIAAGAGNFLSVLLVVLLSSGARSAVVGRRGAGLGAARTEIGETSHALTGATVETLERVASAPESKGRERFKRWVVRFGVPGASILGPLAIPTQITSSILVAAGTPRRWVLLWQTVAIVLWTTVSTVSLWAALTFLVGV